MEYKEAYKMIEDELINLSEVFWDEDSDATKLRNAVGYMLGYSDGVWNCIKKVMRTEDKTE